MRYMKSRLSSSLKKITNNPANPCPSPITWEKQGGYGEKIFGDCKINFDYKQSAFNANYFELFFMTNF